MLGWSMAKLEAKRGSRQGPEGGQTPGGGRPLGTASLCLLLPPAITPFQQAFSPGPCRPKEVGRMEKILGIALVCGHPKARTCRYAGHCAAGVGVGRKPGVLLGG